MFRAEVELTNHCNIRCAHCPHETISRPSGRMDFETFKILVAKFKAHARGEKFALSFSGMGEPLLHPQLCDFIRYVSDDAFTSFATNAAALNPSNVDRLIAAGLDRIYISFNGDDPATFSVMMGGLSYDRVLRNVRDGVRRAKDTRLKIEANVSITQVNKRGVSKLKALLEREGVGPVTFSLCHSRGGNLRDISVCDTPPMPAGPFTCDVMKNTLFVDWQGIAHICDHDLHGEYTLGDLKTEPLETVLGRRERVMHQWPPLKICAECTDVMKIGMVPLTESGAGGSFRDWVYYLHKDMPDPLAAASLPLRWLFNIYAKEGRQDRFANRLLEMEREQYRQLMAVRQELDALRTEADSLRPLAAANALLRAEVMAMRSMRVWRICQALARARYHTRRVLQRLRPARVVGHIDAATDHGCEGWAFSTAKPERPLGIQIMLNGEPLVAGQAQLPRPDLKVKGIHPTGLCGFRIAWPQGLVRNPGDRVEALAEGAPEPFRLPVAQAAPRAHSHSMVEGGLEEMS